MLKKFKCRVYLLSAYDCYLVKEVLRYMLFDSCILSMVRAGVSIRLSSGAHLRQHVVYEKQSLW